MLDLPKNIRAPNISGNFEGVEGNGAPSGCFYNPGIAATNCHAAAGEGDAKVGFNASKSSSVYGKSTSVQVAAAQVLIIIKA